MTIVGNVRLEAQQRAASRCRDRQAVNSGVGRIFVDILVVMNVASCCRGHPTNQHQKTAQPCTAASGQTRVGGGRPRGCHRMTGRGPHRQTASDRFPPENRSGREAEVGEVKDLSRQGFREEKEGAPRVARRWGRKRGTIWTGGSRLDDGKVEAAAMWWEEACIPPPWTGAGTGGYIPPHPPSGRLGGMTVPPWQQQVGL